VLAGEHVNRCHVVLKEDFLRDSASLSDEELFSVEDETAISLRATSSAVEVVVRVCFLLFQEIDPFPKVRHPTLCDLCISCIPKDASA
jgi:hypothetical protein